MSLLELAQPRQSKPLHHAPVAVPDADIVVLKFGSSVLSSPEDVPAVVSEIYRYARRGVKVVAVVSAFQGQTDALLAHARAVGHPGDNRHLPHYVVLGEEKSAALLAVGCDRVGLKAAALGVRDLGLLAEGHCESATPVALDRTVLLGKLAQHEVVVVPGFGAVDHEGYVVLLGRGGSDLTATLVAAELGLDKVRLLKDVDGVYDGDPNGAHLDKVKRYPELSWDEARKVAGKLVQPQAIDLAQSRGVAIEVSALQCRHASVVGEDSTAPVPALPPRPVRVAVAGCGVVGGGLVSRFLRDHADWELVGVLVRDPAKPRDVHVPKHLLTSDPAALLARAPELVVEALSEAAAGEQLVRAALERGVNVVSANKAGLALDLAGLKTLAQAQGVVLQYSAAVGGGAPVVETMLAAVRAGEVVAFEGVLNGTVNFIVDRLARGDSFEHALQQARAAGFAEEDPSADLQGRDAAAKVRILAHEAFGVELGEDEVSCTPFTPDFAAGPSDWAKVRQVGRARLVDGRVHAEVKLERTPEGSPFRHVKGEHNALRVETREGGAFGCRGRGAGRWPTVESVLADACDVRRQIRPI